MIWKVAEFCGLDVVTYAVLPNHFHVLVRVPKAAPISHHELLRRYELLHPKSTPYQTARIEVIAGWLRHNTPEGVAWREQQLALMGNLPAYMKLVKLRFTRWFNATHKRFGTLWAERYKSVLIEYDRHALLTVAAYVDLNAVRKGLVADPKDYRFCGYAEAVAGAKRARKGLFIVCPHTSWIRVQADYRTVLYATGAAPREKGHVISDEAFQEVMAKQGQLSLPELLRCRWRHLTYSSVLGGPAFVQAFLDQLAADAPAQPLLPTTSASEPQPTSFPSPLHPAPWGDWVTPHRVNRVGASEPR